MSDYEPSIRKNFIYRLMYEILAIIAPLITMPYISRVLGADGVGTYSYASSVITYFMLLSTLGTSSYGIREIARNREDKKIYSKIFWEIELLTVFTTSVCIIAWLILVFCSYEYRYVFFALTPFLFATMFDISWFYTAHERLIYSIIWNSICKLLGIVLLFVFVKDGNDLVTYTVINSGIQLFGNMSMWIFLPRLLVSVDYREFKLKKHFRESLVYFIPAVATTVYTVLDKTLINRITGDVYQNGYYEQATKIINMVKTLVFSSVNVVMGARVSYLFSRGKYDEIKIRLGRTMDFILLIGYGCFFGILAIARNFVPIFFGVGYEPVVHLLYIMSALIIIIGISNCLGSQYYTPSGRRRQSSKFIIIGSFVNLILNLVFIPCWGADGATIASIIAELFITVLYVYNCNGYLTVRQIFLYSWKRVLAGIVMMVAVLNIGYMNVIDPIIRVGMQLISGVILYFFILLLLRDSMLVEVMSSVHGTYKK